MIPSNKLTYLTRNVIAKVMIVQCGGIVSHLLRHGCMDSLVNLW